MGSKLNISNDENEFFESERCFIRKFTESDLDDFIMYRNNLKWMRYQSFKGLSKAEYKKSLIKEFKLCEGNQLAIIRKSDKVLIGDVYVKQIEKTFWIGYTINPLFKRQGYSHEVLLSLIAWVKKMGRYDIMAAVQPENIPSIRLLKKTGFLQAGIENGELLFFLRW